MATRINAKGVHEIQLADGSWVVATASLDSAGAVVYSPVGTTADTAWQGESTGTEISLLKAIAFPAAPRSRNTVPITTTRALLAIPAGTKAIGVYASVTTKVGVSASASPASATQQIQTITAGDATGGTATYTLLGLTTAATAWNAAAATFQTNLRAIHAAYATAFTCAGGTLDAAPVTVTMVAGQLDGTIPLITVDGTSLTGGVSALTRVPTITISTPAVSLAGFVLAGTEKTFEVASADVTLILTGIESLGATGYGQALVTFYS